MITTADIRAALHARIDGTAPPGSVVIDEYTMSSCIADVAVFTPSALDVYEIKSDADSPRRLAGQVAAYRYASSTCTLVAGEKMFTKCSGVVPDWWGLWITEPKADGVLLYEARAASTNPEVLPSWVVHLMWSTEIWGELKKRELHRGMSKRRSEWADTLLAAVGGVDPVRAVVFEHIQKRQWWHRRQRSVRTTRGAT